MDTQKCTCNALLVLFGGGDQNTPKPTSRSLVPRRRDKLQDL